MTHAYGPCAGLLHTKMRVLFHSPLRLPRDKLGLPTFASAQFRANCASSLSVHRLFLALLLLQRTMPKFSRFYSATEAEAAANVNRLFPQQSERAQFSSDDAENLAGVLNGTAVSTSRPRNDVNQPLFRPNPPAQSVEQLLNASGFSVSHETVHRDKLLHYKSSSVNPVEWKARSRTPSSDEPSPRKYRIPSPTLSAKAGASSTSDGSDDGLAHV